MKPPPTVSRLGINLANRHARILLEASPRAQTAMNAKSPATKVSAIRYFRGLQVPERPRPPSTEECCMSRCESCVHDIYLKSLDRYHHNLVEICSTLLKMGVPSHEWPVDIQTHNGQDTGYISQEERIAIEAAKHALQAMDSTTQKKSNYRDLIMEAGRLILWTLRGCPG